jgi:hypothetical protein
MLIIDDILLSPVRGINWIFRKIHELAEEELEGESDRIRQSLTELYMMLETGQISEEEFEQKEKELLDRLDALEDEDVVDDEKADDDEDDVNDDNHAV